MTIRRFKGKTLCDMREFYLRNQEPLPGKKGAQRGQLAKLLCSGSMLC